MRPRVFSDLCPSKAFRARVNVLRSEFDRLFGADDVDGQSPFEIFVARQLSVQPPTPGTNNHERLALLVEPGRDWRSALHPIFQKVVEACAGASFGEELVARRDNIERVEFEGNVERVGASAGWPQHNLQSSFPAFCRPAGRDLIRQLAVDEPTGKHERDNQPRAKNNGKQAV